MKLSLNTFIKNKKLTFLIIILICALALLSFFDSEKTDVEKAPYEKEDVAKLEKRLSSILSMIDGAGEVDVMITLNSEGEKLILKDADEGSRSSIISSEDNSKISEKTVMKKDGSKEEPFVRKVTKAEVRGIIVCADGADNLNVKSEITSACMAVLDIPITRISVVSRRKD